MKIRADRPALADALAWAAGHLDPRPTIPARAGLLLEADEQGLTVSGVDWSITTRAAVDADVITPGRAVIPGRLAAQVAGSYRSDAIEITADTTAELVAGRDRFTLPLLAAEDYPAAPTAPAPDGIVDGAELATAVRQVAVATDPTAAIAALGAIQLDADGDAGTLTLWATDRYRGAWRTIPWAGGTGSALVPARQLTGALKGMTDGPTELALNGDVLGVATSVRRITQARVDATGQQDPRAAARANWPVRATVPRAGLLAAIKRAGLAAGTDRPKVLIGLGADEISVRAAGPTGSTVMDIVDGRHHDGPPLQIAFLLGFIADGLTAIDADDVVIHAMAPNRPALLAPTGDTTDYRYLVMPVRL